MPKDYIVGRFYRRIRDEKDEGNRGIILFSESGVFQCHDVDNYGNCWSMNCMYLGDICNDGSGYVVAVNSELESGSVVEVETIAYPK